MTKKKILAIGLAILMMFVLAGCGGSKSNVEVDLKGVFIIEPEDETWIKALDKDLDDGLCYVLAVYDMQASTKANVELNTQTSLLMNNANEYTPVYDSNKRIGVFLENSGYKYNTGDEPYTLLAGNDPLRFCMAFEVNKNDFADNYNGKISIKNSDSKTIAEYKLTQDNCQTVACFDDIFIIENEPENYQMAHSIKARTSLAIPWFSYYDPDFAEIACMYIVDSSNDNRAGFGVSCATSKGNFLPSSGTNNLDMLYSVEVTSQYFPDLKDTLDLLETDCQKYFNHEYSSSSEFVKLIDHTKKLLNTILNYEY